MPSSTTTATCSGPTRSPVLARPYYAGGGPGLIVAALGQVLELLETATPFLGPR